MKYRYKFCDECNSVVMAEREQSVDELLGIILSLSTLGLFIPIWIMLIIKDCDKGYSCSRCNTKIK